MQTIATTLTSCRSVLVENLTAVSTISPELEAQIGDCSKEEMRLKEEIEDVYRKSGYNRTLFEVTATHTLESRITTDGSMLSPIMIGDIPKLTPIMSGDTSTKLLILYGSEIEKSAIIEQIQESENVFPGLLEFVLSSKDLKNKMGVKKLVVYDAKSCSDMIDLIEHATSLKFPVHFMGVGLIDINNFGHWSNETKYDENKEYYLVRSDVETMIQRIMNQTKSEHAKQLAECGSFRCPDEGSPKRKGLPVLTGPTKKASTTLPYRDANGKKVSLPHWIRRTKKQGGLYAIRELLQPEPSIKIGEDEKYGYDCEPVIIIGKDVPSEKKKQISTHHQYSTCVVS